MPTAINTPAAAALASAITRGTTGKNRDYRVLWMGKHLAIVHWKGGSTYRFGASERISGDVTLRDLSGDEIKRYLAVSRDVDSYPAVRDYEVGMLTAARLAAYIADATERDDNRLDELKTIAAARKAANAHREEGYRLDEIVRVTRADVLVAALGTSVDAMIAAGAAYRSAVEARKLHNAV